MTGTQIDKDTARHLTRVVDDWATEAPNRRAVSFLDHADQEHVLTYGDLRRQSQSVSQYLRDRHSPGDRVLLLFPPGLDFVPAFLGCLDAGLVAVPTCYPKPRRIPARLTSIARDAAPTAIITTREVLAQAELHRDQQLRGLTTLAIEDVPFASFEPREPRGDDLAFLQYTSGSTSEPKGVRVTHANIVSNLEAIRRGFQVDSLKESDPPTGVFWLPAYHDMGLVGGILMPLYVGGHSCLMSPQSFLQRPLRWLEAIEKTRATISGAPNFAYELCVEKSSPEQRSRLNLSTWQLAFCGAEPIRASTLHRFADAFAASGFARSAFYPCYGLAETTLMAAGGDGPSAPTTKTVNRERLAGREVAPAADSANRQQTLVGLGRAPRGHQLIVVDPQTSEVLPDGQVGEIWMDGPSKTDGYWNRPRESNEIFQAQLADGTGSYLRTGDLGFQDQGQLYVTGRIKEVIIVRGRNLYPHDIELTVASVSDALRRDASAAFSIDDDGVEELVVVQEVDRSVREVDWTRVVARIRREIIREHELDPWCIVLARQGSIPLTTSGKIQRWRCREKFLDGELKHIHVWSRSAASGHSPLNATVSREQLAKQPIEKVGRRIEAWLLEWLEHRAGVAKTDIDRERPFAEFGLDSLTAVELSHELSEWLELELTPILAWNYPTPKKLADHLATCVLSEGRSKDPETEIDLGAGNDDFEQLLAEIESMSESQAQRNREKPAGGDQFDERTCETPS